MLVSYVPYRVTVEHTTFSARIEPGREGGRDARKRAMDIGLSFEKSSDTGLSRIVLDKGRHVYGSLSEFHETDVGRFHRWLSLIVLGWALASTSRDRCR